MLDLRFVVENPKEVQETIRQRRLRADAHRVAELFLQKNAKIQELEAKKQARNNNAKAIKELPKEEKVALIEEGRKLKEGIAKLEDELNEVQDTLQQEALKLPNLMHPDVPIGLSDKENKLRKQWGKPREASLPACDHVELGTQYDLIDFDTATAVTGTKFYYLKNEAVLLEQALIRYALDILLMHAFTPISTPDLVKEDIALAAGYNPRGEERDIYSIESDGLCLIGTAEIPLAGYYAGKTLSDAELPIHFAGISHCFRREAGAAGKVSKGLYRVHQFSKVEMFTFCTPETSDAELSLLLAIEEEIMQGLELPYQVVDVCSGELGAPAYRKYDIEAWMPGRSEGGSWGEVTSASNCTSYQARRLGIRYKQQQDDTQDTPKGYVHTLNGTALAVSRILLAILENYQQEHSIAIPTALQAYCGITQIKKKR